MRQTLPFLGSTKTCPDFQKAMVTLSQPALDTAFIKTQDNDIFGRFHCFSTLLQPLETNKGPDLFATDT